MDVINAQQTAEQFLANTLPVRWAHTQSVAATAARHAERLGLDPDVAVAAAWLHDIGYAPGLADTGFHPIDGARFLRNAGWPAEVVNLVAHHSCSRIEAGQRGLLAELGEFEDTPGPARDVVWTSDATTGPTGVSVSVDDRVSEVLERYGASHLVSWCMTRISPEMHAAADRVAQASTHRLDALH